MEQKKKRHNPEITPEDLAVKAFDSLESVIQESKEHPEPANIVKTDEARRLELCELINNFFGKDVKPAGDRVYLDTATSFRLYKYHKTKWYKPVKTEKYLNLEIDFDEQIRNPAEYELKREHFVENGKYAPLKLTAHTTEALERAKLFATVYRVLTSQNVSIIQNCPDSVIKDQVLEEKVKEEAKQEISEEEVWKEVKKELKSDAKQFGDYFVGMGFALSIFPYVLPSTVKFVNNIKPDYSMKFTKAENAGAATGAVVGVLGLCGQAALYANFPQLLLIPVATNLGSAGYEWIKGKYNTVKERKKKELEGKNE